MCQNLIDDQAARNSICTDIFSNFFVEAGAGSGKTYNLVKRMVAMVENGIPVSRICAITFTKAAANEFYARFHSELSELAANAEPGTQRYEYLTDALQNIDLCFMGTIDAFCGMILREHPAEARIPSDAAVISDDEALAAYTLAYSEIANGAYGEPLRKKYVDFRKFQYYPKDAFVKALPALTELRNYEFVLRDENDQPWTKEDCEKELTEIVEIMDAVERRKDEELCPTDEFRSQFETAYHNIDALRDPDWDDPNTVINALKGFSELRLAENSRIAQCYGEDYFTFVRARAPRPAGWKFKKHSDTHTSAFLSEDKYFRTVDFLCDAARAVPEQMRKQGKLTFFDSILYLRDMLKEDIEQKGGRLVKHISERHSYFLIDEFQDTNPLQAEIFFYLAAEHPTPDWRACVPRPGALFIVGDPKQSIYRFNGADVASYLDVKALFPEGVLKLSRNRRSVKELCEFFNSTFPTIFPSEDTEMQCTYPQIPAEENPETGDCFGGVFRYEVGKSPSEDEPPETEPDIVCRIIERLVNKDAYRIIEKGAPERKLRYSDFMVLLTTKSGIDDFVAAFSRRNIPVKAEGNVNFGSCPALRALTTVYAAAARPKDSAALYEALLHGPFGLTEEHVRALFFAHRSLNLFTQIADGDSAPAAVSAFRQLQAFALQAAVLSPAAAVIQIQQQLRLFEKTGADALETYSYAIELLRSKEYSGEITGAADAADYLKLLVSGRSSNEYSLSLQPGRLQDRVHLANLHKVKGLEAPVVILTWAATESFRPQTHASHSENRCWPLRFSPKGEYFPIYDAPGFKDQKQKEKMFLAAENSRKVYVAATRAKNALIIAGGPKENYWSSLYHNAERDFFETCPGESTLRIMQQEEIAPLYAALPDAPFAASEAASYTPRKPSEHRSHAAVTREDDPIEVSAEEAQTVDDEVHTHTDDGLHAAQRGTMVHRLMELMVTSKNRIDPETAIRQILDEQELTESADPRPAQTLRTVAQTVRSGGYAQRNGSTPDILQELLSADEVHCEVPFCLQSAEEPLPVLTNGIMDLIYRKDGAWHIVDYKTNENADDLETVYRDQLDAYIRAFRTLTGETADARIYHIDC